MLLLIPLFLTILIHTSSAIYIPKSVTPSEQPETETTVSTPEEVSTLTPELEWFNTWSAIRANAYEKIYHEKLAFWGVGNEDIAYKLAGEYSKIYANKEMGLDFSDVPKRKQIAQALKLKGKPKKNRTPKYLRDPGTPPINNTFTTFLINSYDELRNLYINVSNTVLQRLYVKHCANKFNLDSKDVNRKTCFLNLDSKEIEAITKIAEHQARTRVLSRHNKNTAKYLKLVTKCQNIGFVPL